MTSAAQVRKAALALPEVEQHRSDDATTFSVAGREFVRLTASPAAVELQLPADDPVHDDVPAAQRLPDGGVRIALDAVNGMQSNALVRRAWLARAPERLAAPIDGAATAAPGQVGDLPAAIGRPATQALAAAGLTTLAAVAARSPDEVGALHGVGPKALRILRESLAAHGTTWV